MPPKRILLAAWLGLLPVTASAQTVPTQTPPNQPSAAQPPATPPLSTAAPSELSATNTLTALPDQNGMVLLPGGEFMRGSNSHLPEEAPAHLVRVPSFCIDAKEVTNAQFAQFVEATGYRTFAETPLNPADFPQATAEALVPGALVFRAPPATLDPSQASLWQWWSFVPGANWRHPEGPESNIAERMDHPVVCVTYEDAEAYCRWANKRLPTAAEWEYAARGGLDRADYPWGNEFNPNDQWMANTFQGDFPAHNSAEDGYASTAPVGHYPANGFGLYDVAGNVWEITADWFVVNEYIGLATQNLPWNPKGPGKEAAIDPQIGAVPQRTIKGGSFLCAPSYCNRYRPAARQHMDRLSPTNHIGFRAARDARAF